MRHRQQRRFARRLELAVRNVFDVQNPVDDNPRHATTDNGQQTGGRQVVGGRLAVCRQDTAQIDDRHDTVPDIGNRIEAGIALGNRRQFDARLQAMDAVDRHGQKLVPYTHRQILVHARPRVRQGNRTDGLRLRHPGSDRVANRTHQVGRVDDTDDFLIGSYDVTFDAADGLVQRLYLLAAIVLDTEAPSSDEDDARCTRHIDFGGETD